jgi:hypothetical protein
MLFRPALAVIANLVPRTGWLRSRPPVGGRCLLIHLGLDRRGFRCFRAENVAFS